MAQKKNAVPAVPEESLPATSAGPIQLRTDHPFVLTARDIEVLVSTSVIPEGTPEGNIEMYVRFCRDSNLNPFKRQVHLIKRKAKDGDRFVDRYTIQTSIDGYRAIADRTGKYAGSEDAKFDEGLSQYQMIASRRERPTTATVTVWKMIGGMRCGFTATAGWREYCQTYPKSQDPTPMWAKMPFAMLAKCAEALALRRAFPDEIGGAYTDEEMMQADPVPTIPVEEVKKDPVPSPAKDEKKEEKKTEKKEIPATKGSGVVDPEAEKQAELLLLDLIDEAKGAVNEQHLKDLYSLGKRKLDAVRVEKLKKEIIAVQESKFAKKGEGAK